MEMGRLKTRLVMAFVAWHAATVVLLSIPAPTGARSDRIWEDRFTQKQLLGWTGWMIDAGLFDSPEALIGTTRDAATAILDVRDLIVAPFTPYATLVGAGQGWQMFATLNDEPARLSVEIRYGPNDPWEPLYVARDPAHAWRGALLDEERSRAFMNNWSWGRGREDFRKFARWLAGAAAADLPDADAVRVSMLRAKLPTPEQLRAGELPPETMTWAEVLRLGAFRAKGAP